MSKSIFLLFAIVISTQASAAQAKNLVSTGYIDVQYHLGHGTLNLNNVNIRQGEANSFGVYDGAIGLSDTFDGGEFVLEIPFRQSRSNSQQTNDFDVAMENAQAYIEFAFRTKYYLRAGQFDGFYGLEANDTIDLFFPRHGAIYEVTPNTHTGVLTGWTNKAWKFQFVIGNANQVGQQDPNMHHELGAQLGWRSDTSRFDLNTLVVSQKGNYQMFGNSVSRDLRPEILLNLVGETRFRGLQIGAEAIALRSRYDKAFVNGQLKTKPIAYGFLVQAIYDVTETWGVGIRYDYTKDDPHNEFAEFVQSNVAAGNTLTGYGGHYSKLTVGVRYILNEQLTAKAGFETNSIHIGTDDAQGQGRAFNSGQAALLYAF